tara:strand:- start:297 stop:572 length:276 start_codon:yes stop_codon:yes gene_type:complete
MKTKKLKAETLKRGQKIMREYIPTFWNSEDYGWMILGVMMDNPNWTDAMILFVETHEHSHGYRKMITQTLMHDVGGLMRDDEHFLPRICQQ